MMDDWPVLSIADCASSEPYATQIGPFGKAIMAEDYKDSGVPVLRGANVNHGRFHDDDFVYITEEAADKLAKYESYPGDVLLVHRGTLGQIGLMPAARKYSRYIMGNSMLRVRCDRTRLLPEFLYYWLSSGAGQDYLFSRVSQVGVPALQRPLTTLREARLRVPPLRVQRAIARRLGVLDEKLEVNERLNRTLEAIAGGLFRAWFVNYEPVRRKIAGASAYAGMEQSLFDALPTDFVETDRGPSPAGWDQVPFSDLVQLSGGGTPKRGVSAYWNGSIPWFSVRDAPRSDEVWVVDTQETITQDGVENSAARVVRAGTTIISARGTVGRLALTAVPMAFNQSCYGIQGKGDVGDLFVYFAVRDAVADLQQRSHGSVFDTVTRKTFDSLHRVLPPTSMVEAFERQAAPYLNAIRVNQIENRALEELRSLLMPQFMAGKLRVGEDEVGESD